MTDAPQSDSAQVDDFDDEPQAGTPSATPQAGEPTGIDALPEWARKEIKTLRANEARARTAEKQRQQADMTEAQRWKAEHEALSTEHTALKVELRSMKAQAILSEAGALDPALLAPLLPDEAVSGDKRSVSAAIARLREQYPRQFKSGSADGGAGRTGVPRATNMNDVIRNLGTRS